MKRNYKLQLKKAINKYVIQHKKVPSYEEFFNSNLKPFSKGTFSLKGFKWNEELHDLNLEINMKSPRPKKLVICKKCKTKFEKQINQIEKTNNNFCSKSCAAIYNNTHKKHGTRRSKLEKYLEEELTKLYPNLEIHFNRKDAINSELDIYIPSLSLAFEINGIFHYEPIYGQEKLDKIQNNDKRKFAACHDANISLCIIDASSLKYFKPKNAKKYLDIVSNIIDDNI